MLNNKKRRTIFYLLGAACIAILLIKLLPGLQLPILSRAESHQNKIYYRDRAVVLLYHNFAPKERGTAITPDRFKDHIDMLVREGFNLVSVDDVARFVQGEKKLPPNAVAITMDDGYESNYTVAYPLLKKNGWSAAVFVRVADMGPNRSAGLGNKWLDWPEIKTMSRNNIYIGSHTYEGHQFVSGTYPKGKAWLTTRLKGESQAGYEARIFSDLSKSKRILEERLQVPVEHFAYPFGMYNPTVEKMVKNSGYKYAWTTNREPVTRNSSLYALGRVSVGIGGTTSEQVRDTIIRIGTMEKK